MDDSVVDEKKPFDAEEVVKEEREPDPDEQLQMDSGGGRIWCVKVMREPQCDHSQRKLTGHRCSQVPKHLMEKWSAITQENIHLATIRVYNSDQHQKQRIVMMLPPDAESTEPDEYELDMVHEAVENQIVVANREKMPGSRARTTVLTGRVKHDCNLRPSFSEAYRKRMRERHRAANTPTRQIRLIDEVIPGGRGGVNMLSSGIAPTGGFSSLVVSYPCFETFQIINSANY